MHPCSSNKGSFIFSFFITGWARQNVAWPFPRPYVDNLIRFGCRLCAIVAYNCVMKKLKPSGVSHTVYPKHPIKNFDNWLQYIRIARIVAKRHHEKLTQ